MADPSSSQGMSGRTESDGGETQEQKGDHGVSIGWPRAASPASSDPQYQSPVRHHQRTPSRARGVKETLDARSRYGSSSDDGATTHQINQYEIKQEIGRGSFGSVHLAVDRDGVEYAVKEFSKSRLRKRAQSNLLRQPNRRRTELPGIFGRTLPVHRHSSSEVDDNKALDLIKEEIAIMKKLNHNNLVSLIEVLDDPEEDSLYMVLEMCKKGVAMKVGLDERAEPYDDDTCRCWFRDMVLGIEYLHAQGIIHRDIKPDNCLITNDDVLKIVDFGVSEMFEKASEMATTKSAGSPAFMPPELCVAKHGPVSGRAVDIWSMGVTLYCLRYGRVPFEKSNMLDMYESIRTDDVDLGQENDRNFADLIRRMLEKNPNTRITMEAIREHPWVTKDGTDMLLSAEENCADLVEPPTEHEMDHAITDNFGSVMTVLKAARNFKSAVTRKRGDLRSFFDRSQPRVASPGTIHPLATAPADHPPSESPQARGKTNKNPSPAHSDVSRGQDHVDVREAPGLKRSATLGTELQRRDSGPTPHSKPVARSATMSPTGSRAHVNAEEHARGHAHDPLKDRLFLQIGSDPSAEPTDSDDEPVVSESPSGVDTDIYEQAYREEMDRIMAASGTTATMFMNRRVEHRDDIRLHSNIRDAGTYAMRSAADKLTALHARGSLVGDAGRDAALNTYESLTSTDWRAEVESRRLNAVAAATDRYESGKSAAQTAASHLAPAMEKAATGFTGIVAMAQGKAQESLSRQSEADSAGKNESD